MLNAMVSLIVRSRTLNYVKQVVTKSIPTTIKSSYSWRNAFATNYSDTPHEPFILKDIPKQPNPVMSAYDYYVIDKKGLSDDPVFMSNNAKVKLTHVEMDRLKYEFDILPSDEKKKFVDLSLKDIYRFKSQQEHYEQTMKTTLTVKQLMDWIVSSNGQLIISLILGKNDTNYKEKFPVKKACHAYNHFCRSYRANINRKTTMKAIADIWRNMSDEEKKPYTQMAIDDRERYNREIIQYMARLNGDESNINTKIHHGMKKMK